MRRDTEPMGPVRPREMTPEEKRAYYEGPKPTPEQIRAITGRPPSGFREGYKASELGLKSGDWDDPRYREIYTLVMIFREDVEDDRPPMRSQEIGLRVSELDDPDYEVIFVGPGRRTLDEFIDFLARFSGRDLEVKRSFDPDDGYAIVRITERMRKLMRKRGFRIDELEFELGTATD